MHVPSLIIVASVLLAAVLHAEPLPPGSPAPQLTATDQNGKPIHFASVYAKGVTLVYFYPKAGTSGCTAEACSLRDSYSQLEKEGVQIIGVSRDSVQAQNQFQRENHLPFTLVADPNGEVSSAFGVPKMLGVLPLDARQSFLVKDDKIVWNSPNAQTAGSAKEVQKALADLK